MNLTMQRDALLALTKQAAYAAPDIANLPEVSGIHFAAGEKAVTLTATNFEIAIRATGAANVTEGGSMIVDTQLFPEIISKLPEKEVLLETEKADHRLHIKSGHAEFHIGVLPGRNYNMPQLPMPLDMVTVTGIPTLARRTAFAASSGEKAKAMLKGVYITLSRTGLMATACNGVQLVQAFGDKECMGDVSFLMPARALKVLARLSDDESAYRMGLTDKSVVFTNETVLFSSRRIEGGYLDANAVFSSVLPVYRALVKAPEFCRAVESACIVASAGAPVALTIHQDRLALECSNAAPPPEGDMTVEEQVAMAHSWFQNGADVKATVVAVEDKRADAPPLPLPNEPFYYHHGLLTSGMGQFSGDVILEFSARGDLIVRDQQARYFQPPVRPQQAQTAAKKPRSKSAKGSAPKAA